jgi:hypothetical protein
VQTHTILGTRSQRGLTQLALDVIFRSLGHNILNSNSHPALETSISASDSSEATILSASTFLEAVYGDATAPSRASSRAPTPMIVRSTQSSPQFHELGSIPSPPRASYPVLGSISEEDEEPTCISATSPKSIRVVSRRDSTVPIWYQDHQYEDVHGQHTVSASPHSIAQYGTSSDLHRGSQYRRAQQDTTPAKGSLPPSKHFMTSTASILRKKTETKTSSQLKGESIGPMQTPSRRLNRPSAFPQQPDISSLTVSCDPAAEYAVVISMYEVYNDRIFDLLTPPIKSAATKEYRRRPLLFKSTEASPDRKVVAGLRKVVCGSLHQALMVLEAGLHERRVAGTGSNSVSSRSHGFFAVEVKKRAKGSRRHGIEMPWGGSTLTIVDLAGSERARDAKTAGATLAEAGKINESLMYLGQCLQMQSDAANKDKVAMTTRHVPLSLSSDSCADREKPNLVPFRQCKLTELLFSNCFPSTSSAFHSSTARHRNPQKAAMIVTADPNGDYNATSQILRYSALAREVTVPRIPSITHTILTAPTNAPAPSSSPIGSPTLQYQRPFPAMSPPVNMPRTFSPPGSSPGNGGDDHRSTMEMAALEIARLSEEVDYLRQALQVEQSARMEAEAHLLSMEDRMVDLEQAIREDCTAEFERRFDIEMARWRANMQVEMERGEEHWGRKIEVFERMAVTVTGASDVEDEDKENVLTEDVNEENDRLRRDNEILRRELAAMSPTKRVPLSERGSDAGAKGTEGGSSRSRTTTRQSDEQSLRRKLENLKVSDDTNTNIAPVNRNSGAGSRSSSPTKKVVRKLATKRWDNNAGDDDDLF